MYAFTAMKDTLWKAVINGFMDETLKESKTKILLWILKTND